MKNLRKGKDPLIHSWSSMPLYRTRGLTVYVYIFSVYNYNVQNTVRLTRFFACRLIWYRVTSLRILGRPQRSSKVARDQIDVTFFHLKYFFKWLITCFLSIQFLKKWLESWEDALFKYYKIYPSKYFSFSAMAVWRYIYF